MENRFDYAENTISSKRSTFKRRHTNLGSCNLGEIIPFYTKEIYPGDTVQLNTASVIRTGALVAPLYANLYQDIYYFFVPNRLIWTHWPQFLGENDTEAWTESTEYTIPSVNMENAAAQKTKITANNLLNYMQGWGNYEYAPYGELNELPLRAYYMIYNEWFRNQAFEAPIIFSKGDETNETGLINYFNTPCIANKFRDYYTSILPEPQKGEAVQLPLGDYAPINATTETYEFSNSPRLFARIALSQGDGQYLYADETGTLNVDDENTIDSDLGTKVDTHNLIADLSKATAATIESLRVAYATQRYLERDALFGTRMDEVIQSHFGVNNGANDKYIPEYLTGERYRLNIDQVLATAQTGDNTSVQNPQGNVAGWSCTGNITEGFTKSFVEHGWLIGISVIRQEEIYCDTIDKSFRRKNKLDFYWPEFANIGEQPIMKSETGYLNASDNYKEDEVFGYQEAWADLRYDKNIVSGILNPQTELPLNYWTLANPIDAGQASFLKANKKQLDRALAISSDTTGAQFIFDITTNATWTRILPLFSEPSLVDKH